MLFICLHGCYSSTMCMGDNIDFSVFMLVILGKISTMDIGPLILFFRELLSYQ